MKRTEAKRKLEEMQLEMEIESRASNLNRARSVTVGTAFGGTTEIMMRSDGGRHIWCIMQPVEVIELIHQLAANVGCHMALKPREDFSSWRDWKVSDQEKLHYNGWAPFGNDLAPHMQIGANMQKYEEEKLALKQQKIEENFKPESSEKPLQIEEQQDADSLDLYSSDINIETLLKHEENKEARSILNAAIDGSPNVVFGENNEILNKVIVKENGITTMLGGPGGNTDETLAYVIRKKKVKSK